MINFLSSFASYLLLMIIIVVLCGVAVFIGITLRRAKDKKQLQNESTNEE